MPPPPPPPAPSLVEATLATAAVSAARPPLQPPPQPPRVFSSEPFFSSRPRVSCGGTPLPTQRQSPLPRSISRQSRSSGGDMLGSEQQRMVVEAAAEYCIV